MRPSEPRYARWLEIGLGFGVVLLVLGPVLLRRGFVLVGDMVFVPLQGWKPAWIAADGGVPRAVPGDAVVSVLSHVLGGELLQGLVLGGTLLAAWVGTCRLLGDLPVVARLAGAVCFVWNPYVHERLAIGHWALLCGYAALPWVAWAVLRLRAEAQRRTGPAPDDATGAGTRGRDRGGATPRRLCPGRAWGVLVLGLLVSGWMSPTGGLLALAVALCLAFGYRSLLARVLLAGIGVNLPWIVPAVLNGADQLAPDPFGAEAFAARADTPWGVVGSVLSFGGIWKESIFPSSRGDLLHSGVGVTVALAGLAGLLLVRHWRVLPLGPSLVLAAGSLLLALWGSWDASRALLEWVVTAVPGGGLLRDAQKWAAGWVLVASVGFASLTAAVVELGRRQGVATAGVPLVLLPALALPTFALGLGGFLVSRPYPEEWDRVRDLMVAQEVGQEPVVVLPFATYRRFDWTPRTVLDPAPRYFPGTMVTEDALTVPEGTVGGESALAARVRAARTSEELAQVLSEEGVRWALVHLSTEDVLLPAGAVVVHDGEQLDLLRLAEPTGQVEVDAGGRPVGYALVDGAVLLVSTIVVIRSFTCRNASQGAVTPAYTDRSHQEVWEDS